MFQAASLGKPVFAYGVLKLVQQGRFDLDAPLLTNSEDGLNLMPPAVNSALPGDHGVFKFYMLRDGVSYLACRSLKLCF